MINFLRTLFGLGNSSDNRAVVGSLSSFGEKDAAYARASVKRLNALHNLYLQYKGTVHASKIKTVIEKTKKIHAYLLSKKRVSELELFHVQHTDHFMNTFSKIMEVHLRHTAPVITPVPQSLPRPAERVHRREVPKAAPKPPDNQKQFEEKIEDVLRKIESETIKGIYTAQKVSDMVKRVAGHTSYVPTSTTRTKVPALAVPVISIDTYSKIYYRKEQEEAGSVAGEISFTSTQEDKEVFLKHVTSRLGIDPAVITYMGNAVMAVPDGKGHNPETYVPILHWKGCAYALNLNDYRLFPVRTLRNGK